MCTDPNIVTIFEACLVSGYLSRDQTVSSFDMSTTITHFHFQEITRNSPCLLFFFVLFQQQRQLSGDISAAELSLFSYLTSPQLEVFPLMVTVVGPQKGQDVRPECEHKNTKKRLALTALTRSEQR